MLIVGLTGGIASGKSEVAKILQKCGARIIDADVISRDVMLPQTACWQKVTEAFGKEIVKDDLTIDREKLASIIFDDHHKRLHLNSIVHPEIVQEIERIVARIEQEEPEALVIINAALLVETGVYRSCEKLIVISATEENQLRRLVKRDGMSREAAQKRIDAQLPLGKKVNLADFLIHNDSSFEALQTETMKVYQSVMSWHSSKTI